MWEPCVSKKQPCSQRCEDASSSFSKRVFKDFDLRKKEIFFSTHKGTLHPSVYHEHWTSTHLEIHGFHWTGRGSGI